jgi:hypothetical protein
MSNALMSKSHRRANTASNNAVDTLVQEQQQRTQRRSSTCSIRVQELEVAELQEAEDVNNGLLLQLSIIASRTTVPATVHFAAAVVSTSSTKSDKAAISKETPAAKTTAATAAAASAAVF